MSCGGLSRGYGRGQSVKVATVEAIPIYPELEPMPSPNKGIEALRTAHELLAQTGLVGYLIGGVAEEMQLKTHDTRDEYLTDHKDIDILLAEDYKWPEKLWQYGIDWWKIRRDGSIGRAGQSVPYDVFLKIPRFDFSVNSEHHWAGLEPGLYLPDADETRAKCLLETASKLARMQEPIELLDNTYLEFEEDLTTNYNIKFRGPIGEDIDYDKEEYWTDWIEQRSLIYRDDYDYSAEPIFKIVPPPVPESMEHQIKTGSILRQSRIERIRKLGNRLIDQKF